MVRKPITFLVHDTRERDPLGSSQVPINLTCEMIQTCIERLCNYISGDETHRGTNMVINAPAEIPMYGIVRGVPARVFTDLPIRSVHKFYIVLIQFEVIDMSKLGHR